MESILHCNKCFDTYQKNRALKLFLLECGHIYCEPCLEKNKSSKKCTLCEKPIRGCILLNKDMDPAMKMYFGPTENFVKKTFEINSFQNLQRELFCAHLKQRYEHYKKQCIRISTRNTKLTQENAVLRRKLKKSGRDTHVYTSTPIPQNRIHSTFLDNSESTILPINRKNQHSSEFFSPDQQSPPGVARRIHTSKLSDKSTESPAFSTGPPSSYTSAMNAPLHSFKKFTTFGALSSLKQSQKDKKKDLPQPHGRRLF